HCGVHNVLMFFVDRGRPNGDMQEGRPPTTNANGGGPDTRVARARHDATCGDVMGGATVLAATCGEPSDHILLSAGITSRVNRSTVRSTSGSVKANWVTK